MKVKDKSKKVGLKLNIQKTKIMASSSITSWQIDRETVTDFFFGLQNHCRCDCSHEIKRRLQPRQHIKKQRHYFANKGPSSQSYGFSSSHVYESWTIMKAERQRIDAFELQCWEKTFESPLDCKEIQPVHPKENQS